MEQQHTFARDLEAHPWQGSKGTVLRTHRTRRIVRRAVRAPCHAVTLEGPRLVGERALDLSPYGMLLACDDGVRMGESVAVSFKAPGGLEWFHADGEVVRIVEGWRLGDPGYCVGVRFTRIDLASRMRLHERLRGMPPPVPGRPLRFDYASSVRHIARA
jgi:hypothetical protein